METWIFLYDEEKNYIGCSFKKNELNFYKKNNNLFFWVFKEELPKNQKRNYDDYDDDEKKNF